MRIQHNIMAMNAYRNYTNNVSAMQKNLEKLSSGYKINRAGDDAAGLAISEKMRAQISGLEAAQKNAKDGISLVQTAEGALTEVHDMLNRMVTLATQSANGTYDVDTDRYQLQKEMDQLRDEINRISEASNFNGIKLLDGSMDAGGGKVDGSFTIPDVGTPLGDKTYVHGSGTSQQATEFELRLDTLNINPTEDGATLKVAIGKDEATVDLTKDTKYDAASLATAIAAAFNDATKGTGGKIGGQAFTITADTTNGAVKFVQTAAPTSDDEVVDGSMDVKLTYTPKTGGDAQVLNDDEFVVVYEDTKTGTIGGTPKTDIELVAESVEDAGDAVTGAVAAGAGLAAVLDSEEAPDKGAISVQFADNKWNIIVGSGDNAKTIEATGTVADGVLTLKDESNAVLLTVTASDIPGEDAEEGAATKADEAAFKAAFGTAQATGLTYAAPGSGGGEDEKVKDVSSTVVNAGASFDYDTSKDANLSTVSDLKTALTGLKTSGLKVGENSEVTVDLSSVTFADEKSVKENLKALSDAISKAVDDWNKANTDKSYTYEYKGLSTDGTTAISLQAAGDITALIDKKTKDADPPAAAASGVSGNYNAATVMIKQGAAEKAGSYASTTFKLTDMGEIGDGSTIKIGGDTYTFKLGDSYSVSDKTITLDKNATAAERLEQAGDGLSRMTNSIFSIGHEGGGKIVIDELKGNTNELEKLATKDGIESLLSFSRITPEDKSKGLVLQIGDTAAEYNQLRVSIGACDTASLGIDKISIAEQGDAQKAIDAIKAAINKVSDVRGTLGATQNRLDHTINNLSVMTENIQDAESTIRDVDVAEEMMAYTKNSILIQSAQAMLAQANQIPQGVLQLLG